MAALDTGRAGTRARPYRRMTAREGAAKRRSIRLAGYDYAESGAYFVTVCTQGRAPLLADIVDGELRMNAAGRMIEHWWQCLPSKFDHVALDAFVAMPDHVHGIIVLLGDDAVMAVVPRGRSTDAGHRPGGHAGTPPPPPGGHVGPPPPPPGGHVGPPLPPPTRCRAWSLGTRP